MIVYGILHQSYKKVTIDYNDKYHETMSIQNVGRII